MMIFKEITKKVTCCSSCGEDISFSNTISPEGWREVDLSGICEKCFDDSTFGLDENLGVLDRSILSLLRNGVVLAGGALRALVDPSEEIMDYDLFVLDQGVISKLKADLEDIGYKLCFECPKGQLYTYKNSEGTKVQIINKRAYKDCEDLIASFDITACCAAYDGNTFYTHDRFVFDNLNKIINLNRVEYPNATLRRIVKYSNKGFKLSNAACTTFTTTVNGMILTEDNSEFYID